MRRTKGRDTQTPSLFDSHEEWDRKLVVPKPHRKIIDPQSVQEYAAQYGLTVLRLEGIESRPEQLRIASHAASHQNNLLIQAGTDSGKTYIFGLIAAVALSKGLRVLYSTPQLHLVNQATEDAEKIFNAEVGVAKVTGDLTPTKRKAVYEGQNNSLCIGTPETLCRDIKSGALNLDAVGLIIVDESHRARGNHDQANLIRLAREHTSPVRVVAGSGTIAEDDSEIESVCKLLGINSRGVIKMPTIPKEHSVSHQNIELSPQIIEGAAFIEESAYAVLDDLKSALPDTLTTAHAKKIGKVFDAIKRNGFNVPPSDLMEMCALLGTYEREGARAFSLAHTLCELQRLDHQLTTVGQSSFLAYAGKRLLRAHLMYQAGEAIHKYEAKLYHPCPDKREYEGALRAYRLISANTAFEEFLPEQRAKLDVTIRHLKEESPGKGSHNPEKIVDHLIDAALADYAANATKDRLHPKEVHLLQKLHKILKSNPETRVLVSVDEIIEGKFLSALVLARTRAGKFFPFEKQERISDESFEHPAPFIGGKSVTKSRDRDSVLEDFRSGKTRILIATRVIEEGLHVPQVNNLFLYSSKILVEPKRVEQIFGRVGRGTSGGEIEILTATGTFEPTLRYVGNAKKRQMNRTLQGVEALP